MSVLRVAAATLTAALLAGCYRGPGANSPDDSGAYPSGVVYASPAPLPTGLWSIATDGVDGCCWLGARAAFNVEVPAGAARIRTNVYLPDFGPYDERPETLTIGVDGVPPKTFARLRSGIYSLETPLPARAGPYVTTLRIDAGYAWKPNLLNISSDGRDLSVQLKSVRFR